MNKIIYLLSFVFLFSTCSKKTAEVVETMDNKMDEAMDQSWRNARPSAAPSRPIEIGDYQSFDLKNGLKVIVVENHKLPRVSYQLTLKNKPIIEGSKTGFVSMAGSLISTGTSKRSKAELDAAIDYIGATINTSGTGMYGSALTKHQESLLDIFTEMLYMPSFPEDEFEKAKKQTLSGLAQSKSDPNTIASNVASVINYGKKHPYGEVTTEKTVENISLADCKNYYNTYFSPNNAFLIIVGDISLEEAKMKVNKYFAKWEQKEVPESKIPEVRNPDATNVAFAHKDGAVQSVIRVTYPVDLKPGKPDVLKARILNTILGGGVFAGRLMQNLREDKAYTYGANSRLGADRVQASFAAFASVRNEVTDSSVVEFLYEMERIKNEPVSEEDLQLAKNSIAGSFARSLESPETIANFALNTYRYNLAPDYYSGYLNRLDAITVEDIMMAAKMFIRPDRAHIVVVGSKDDVADKLERFDADRKIDFYDPYGNIKTYEDLPLGDDISVQNIINDYIEAIGGRSALDAVQSIQSEMNLAIMGQTANVVINQKRPNKMAMSITMQGMTLQDQRFDGTTMVSTAMGQPKKTVTEGAEFNSMKEQAEFFPQLNYDLSSIELKGIEEVDGKKAYKLALKDSNGKPYTEYYDVETSLLIRTFKIEAGPGGQNINAITDFSDYKEVEGVLIPHTMTVTGAMPQPMKMEASKIVVNGPMDDSIFSE